MLLTIPECNHFKSQEVGRKRVCPGLIISISLYPVLNRPGGTERKKIEHRISHVIFLKFALTARYFHIQQPHLQPNFTIKTDILELRLK